MLEKLRDWESINSKLKNELEDASHQLIVNGSDLANSKLELQRHRNEIDVNWAISEIFKIDPFVQYSILIFHIFNRDLT